MATHTKPDEDVIVSVTLLKIAGITIEGYWFRKEGDESFPPQLIFKDILWVDRGRQIFDHHGIQGKTSTQIVAEELGIAKENWIQPILRHVYRSDLEGRSEPMDISDITKAISREIKDDEKIMMLGVEIANSLINFHKNNMERDNKLAMSIIEKYFKGKEMPPRIRQYYHLLKNPRFQRSCDFVEILVGSGKKAEEFGETILTYIEADIQKYQLAIEEVKEAQKVIVSVPLGWFIVAGISNNPKFNVAAREIKAALVIQKNTDGHVQIYFNQKVLPSQIIASVSEDLIEILRLREISLKKEKLPSNKKILRSPAKISEVPEWYLFVGERGGRVILNGSLTSPEIPASNIAFSEIIEFALNVLCHYATQLGQRAVRRGIPLRKLR